MASMLSLFNRLLPFATPGTPLLQDLLHLAAICGLLYFAPQIQERFNEWRQQREQPHEHETDVVGDQTNDQGPDVPAHNGQAAQEDVEDRDLDEAQAPDAANGPIPAPDAELLHDDDEAQPGPAGAPNMPAQRNVGAKKAKSLAKRDQRRAYHEFMRSQGEAQRARDAEGAAEREAAASAERDRRRAAEAALEAKKAKEREARREQERREREEEIRRRELAVRVVRAELEERRMCDLWKVARQVGGDVDEEWVERILRASGMLGKREGVVTMVTGTGWAVRVREGDMAEVYRMAVTRGGDEEGRVSYDDLGGLLETVLKSQAVK